MRKRKTQHSKRGTSSGELPSVELILPSTRPAALGISPKRDKRRDFQNLYDSLVNSREQFSAWFEEVSTVKIETEAKEIRDCVTDIKKDQKRYWEIIKQLPNVEEISEEELEKRIGKADQLLNLAGEILSMETFLPQKIDELHLLLEHRRHSASNTVT